MFQIGYRKESTSDKRSGSEGPMDGQANSELKGRKYIVFKLNVLLFMTCFNAILPFLVDLKSDI